MTKYLKLKAFVQAAEPDTLRIFNGDGGWYAQSGEAILQRGDGTKYFGDLTHLLGVLASVGIRSCRIEWDGLDPKPDVTEPTQSVSATEAAKESMR